ncbi:MAG TPA: penicillin-binding transpeptidase domain-containing protein [Nocardioidaceae bacterium]|nr:penicillin-binding transpeptidase domain-containing protein [Nocardioidaceae bacterium]
MRARRVAAAVATIALVGTGCTSEENSPQDDAEAFAAALAGGRLTGIAVTAKSPARPQTWWAGIREGMGDSKLTVRVTSVSEAAESRATATLAHEWRLEATGEPAWSYETTVPMVLRDDTWAFELTPKAVVAGLRDGELLDLSTVTPERGDILGAGGRPIVTERPVVRLGIDKTQVRAAQAGASARRLAAFLDVDAAELVERVEAAGDKAWVEALVLRQEDVAPSTGDTLESIPGAGAIADEIPLAPTREFARPVLGTVGPVTAEMIEESEGEYAAGDVAGLSGLQQRYDDRLRGVPGTVVEAVSEKTGDERELYRSEPKDGRPLRTTLDTDLQLLAERVLSDVGPASAIVALRPSTGELLAVASGPGSAGYSTATIGQYAPGSTFKVVSSLALLRSGMSPQDTVACPPTTVVDGKEFENYDDYPSGSLGEITLREALAQSCNTAFVSQHDRVAPADVADAAAALGLGEDHDIGFPGYFGEVPAEGSETERAAALIGQGRVLASPMAMAAVAGSVASGETVVPRLLAGTEGEASPEAPLTSREATALQELMAAVVAEGSGSALADVPGARVLAKTGTAEFGVTRPPRTHAWMIAARGDLAVAVFVEVGESGSQTAGPLLEEFLRGAS